MNAQGNLWKLSLDSAPGYSITAMASAMISNGEVRL